MPGTVKTVDDSGERSQRREFDLRLPGGLNLHIRGYDLLSVIASACAVAIAWMIYDMRHNSAAEHNAIITTGNELVYLSVQPEAERERIRQKLDMPTSLREKLRKD